MFFAKLLPFLFVLPLASYAAKGPKKPKRPLPACLIELNEKIDSLMAGYQKLSRDFPINEKTRPAVYHYGDEFGSAQQTDRTNRRFLEKYLDLWVANQRGWKAWETHRDLQKLGDFPLIAGIVTVVRDLPTEHYEASIGFQTHEEPHVISRTYIGIVDHFDAKANRVYVREISGTNEGSIVSIDVDAPEFVAHLHKAPKPKR